MDWETNVRSLMREMPIFGGRAWALIEAAPCQVRAAGVFWPWAAWAKNKLHFQRTNILTREAPNN